MYVKKIDILEIANKINNAGGTLYLVGGAVRDNILGKKIHDRDYCIVGIDASKIEEILPKAKKRGKSFEVYDVNGVQFAMARKETKSGVGHKEFEIEIGKNITIEEDLKRRDITINSIAQDVITGKIIDPYGGVKDIENKIIRATSKAFAEDPLRVYRVARFAACLEFTVENETIKMIKGLKEELNTLSVERVFEEFKKALTANKPSIFFEVLKKAEVLDVHFEEIYNLIGKTQPIEHHPEGDSYNHTMMVLDNSAKLTKDILIRFCCLVHDLGKGKTPEEMLPHHYNHEARGVELIGNLGKRLKIPNVWIKCGKLTAKEHMRAGIFDNMRITKQVDFITNISKSKLGLKGMKIVVISDRWRDEVKPKVKFAKIGRDMQEQINGKYIIEKYKINDGEEVGKLLRKERIEWLKKNIDKY